MNRFDYNIFICSFKFISKPDEWFVEGTEVKLINPYTWPPLNITKINNGTGLFQGRTTSTHSEITEERTDTESCQFDEFYIYDKCGNEISELTIDEYKSFIRDYKIKKILDYV